MQHSSPQFEKYLKDVGSVHLLWRYYFQNHMYAEAAVVFFNMAEEGEVSLGDRITISLAHCTMLTQLQRKGVYRLHHF